MPCNWYKSWLSGRFPANRKLPSSALPLQCLWPPTPFLSCCLFCWSYVECMELSLIYLWIYTKPSHVASSCSSPICSGYLVNKIATSSIRSIIYSEGWHLHIKECGHTFSLSSFQYLLVSLSYLRMALVYSNAKGAQKVSGNWSLNFKMKFSAHSSLKNWKNENTIYWLHAFLTTESKPGCLKD